MHCIQTLQKYSIGSGKPPSGEQPSAKDSTHGRTTDLDHKPSTTSLSLSYTSDTKGYEGIQSYNVYIVMMTILY